MTSPVDPFCAECHKHKRRLPNGLRPACFRMPAASRMEAAAGDERFKCEHCGAMFLVRGKAGSH